jgi:hypothetical protein
MPVIRISPLQLRQRSELLQRATAELAFDVTVGPRKMRYELVLEPNEPPEVFDLLRFELGDCPRFDTALVDVTNELAANVQSHLPAPCPREPHRHLIACVLVGRIERYVPICVGPRRVERAHEALLHDFVRMQSRDTLSVAHLVEASLRGLSS